MNEAPTALDFYAQPTLDVAQKLLGQTLTHVTDSGVLSGIIVETEAYITPGDDACHAYRGETQRNSVMFRSPGLAYVYRSYGIHAMLNVVTEREGVAAAVLIRAVEPVLGLEQMMQNRGLVGGPLTNTLVTNGPGKLCQAMNIHLGLNGADLRNSELCIRLREVAKAPVLATTRIGITRSVELPWRFYLLGNPYVSVRDKAAEQALQI